MASQWWSQFITSRAAFLQLPASRCSSMNSKHEKWRCHCLAVTNYTTSVWWQPGNVLNPKGFQEHRTISSSLKMNSQNEPRPPTTVDLVLAAVAVLLTVTFPEDWDTLGWAGATAELIHPACPHVCMERKQTDLRSFHAPSYNPYIIFF